MWAWFTRDSWLRPLSTDRCLGHTGCAQQWQQQPHSPTDRHELPERFRTAWALQCTLRCARRRAQREGEAASSGCSAADDDDGGGDGGGGDGPRVGACDSLGRRASERHGCWRKSGENASLAAPRAGGNRQRTPPQYVQQLQQCASSQTMITGWCDPINVCYYQRCFCFQN